MGDYIDSHRQISQLVKAKDAMELDNTNLSEKDQFNIALKFAYKKLLI